MKHLNIISMVVFAAGAALTFNGLQLQEKPHAKEYKTIGVALLVLGALGMVGEGFIKKKA